MFKSISIKFTIAVLVFASIAMCAFIVSLKTSPSQNMRLSSVFSKSDSNTTQTNSNTTQEDTISTQANNTISIFDVSKDASSANSEDLSSASGDEQPAVPKGVAKLITPKRPGKAITFSILADGYSENDYSKFFTDAERLSNFIIQSDVFSKYKNNVSTYGIMLPSETSSLESKSPITNGFFMTEDNSSRNNLLPVLITRSNNIKADYYIILVNSKKFIGFSIRTNYSKIYESYSVAYVSSDFECLAQNILHELGHTVANLSDEYGPQHGTPYYVESNNLTRNSKSVPWKDIINSDTVGIYRVGDTQWYKSSPECIMNGMEIREDPDNPEKSEFKPKEFCPVCMSAFKKAVENKYASAVPQK